MGQRYRALGLIVVTLSTCAELFSQGGCSDSVLIRLKQQFPVTIFSQDASQVLTPGTVVTLHLSPSCPPSPASSAHRIPRPNDRSGNRGFWAAARVARLGVKTIFYFKDMKVTFTNEKGDFKCGIGHIKPPGTRQQRVSMRGLNDEVEILAYFSCGIWIRNRGMGAAGI